MSGSKSRGWKRIAFILLAGVAIVALASCTPQVTPEPAEGPSEPSGAEATEPPMEEPTEPEAPAAEMESIVITIPEDPPSFNGTLTWTGYERLIQEMTMLGVADLDPYNQPYLELAAEIPTVENGGVVVDEETWETDVTWKLKDNVQWADGEPVTANDVVFTWEALSDPETGYWAPGADATDYMEAVDDYTLHIHYAYPYPAYEYQFGTGALTVWAAHYCDAEQGFSNWDCNEEPLSSGPYVLDEWVSGDHLIFSANPNYYEEGKPDIEQIIIRVVPDSSARKLMVQQGEADLDFWLGEDAFMELEGQPGIVISEAPTSRWLVHLWPNLAARGTFDATETPHPVLSDLNVRKAIRMAISIDEIVDGPMLGLAEPKWSEFNRDPWNCDIPEPAFDPDGARALLTEAGWTDTDGDGVRECHGCTTGAEEGYPLSLEIMTYSEWGGESLENAHQLIGERLQDVGFDIQLTVMQGAVLWDTYENGGVELTGQFDLNLWDDWWVGTDPLDFVWTYYSCEAVDPESGGWNIMRWCNEDFDALMDEGYTLDEEYRQEVFCQMAEIQNEELPTIPLFVGWDVAAVDEHLHGVQASVNNMITWNVQDWTWDE
jgi:peptide/nickel transport system substrate-binding protein